MALEDLQICHVDNCYGLFLVWFCPLWSVVAMVTWDCHYMENPRRKKKHLCKCSLGQKKNEKKWKEDRNVICGSCPFNRKMSSPKGKWMCTSHTCSPFILITPDGVLALCTDGKGRQVSVARHRLINIRHISPQPLSAMHTACFQICFAIEKSQLCSCICIWKRSMSYKGQGSLFLTGSDRPTGYP